LYIFTVAPRFLTMIGNSFFVFFVFVFIVSLSFRKLTRHATVMQERFLRAFHS
jgi:hypothetical protein